MVKITIELLVDEDGYEDLKGKNLLEKIKEDYQDIEILSNNLDNYKVIDVKKTKQTKFKY